MNDYVSEQLFRSTQLKDTIRCSFTSHSNKTLFNAIETTLKHLDDSEHIHSVKIKNGFKRGKFD